MAPLPSLAVMTECQKTPKFYVRPKNSRGRTILELSGR